MKTKELEARELKCIACPNTKLDNFVAEVTVKGKSSKIIGLRCICCNTLNCK